MTSPQPYRPDERHSETATPLLTAKPSHMAKWR
jgi:hypothetical protein